MYDTIEFHITFDGEHCKISNFKWFMGWFYNFPFINRLHMRSCRGVVYIPCDRKSHLIIRILDHWIYFKIRASTKMYLFSSRFPLLPRAFRPRSTVATIPPRRYQPCRLARRSQWRQQPPPPPRAAPSPFPPLFLLKAVTVRCPRPTVFLVSNSSQPPDPTPPAASS